MKMCKMNHWFILQVMFGSILTLTMALWFYAASPQI